MVLSASSAASAAACRERRSREISFQIGRIEREVEGRSMGDRWEVEGRSIRDGGDVAR
jgi:hypothetical protein